ncbi:GNAT family N-acetyltransferase [Sanguibacter sp. 25GB23B1]|uniref:GNAT family N-acetyltransferase n=1 Tax=unclassified Sanguibacter TaxID=2645534 RepID=UPI0032AEBB8F
MALMTERLLPRRPPQARVLTDADLVQALALCALDPVASVLAATRIETAILLGLARTTGQVWGYPAEGPLEAVCWSGANLVPVVPDDVPDAIDAFANLARSRGRRCSSIVGQAGHVLALWDRLQDGWSRPRDVRTEQPSMVLDSDPLVEPDDAVRYSTLDDYPALLPACVEMFIEEVGYSPLAFAGSAYEDRVRSLVIDRHSLIRTTDALHGRARDVVFKAELGAVTRRVAQVQGVWVAPAYRGRGLAASGMAAVVRATRKDVAPVVSLYVNSYNTRALATYRRVGFEQVGTFATVLF